jgi:hypothetical protein
LKTVQNYLFKGKNMKHMKRIKFIAAIMLLLFVAACGGDKNINKPVSITISPMTPTVNAGGSVTLAVTPTNTDIIWPTLPSRQGSYTKNGNQAIYTAPAVTEKTIIEFTVTATANTSKKATATITVDVVQVPEILNFMGRVNTPDGNPLANTEFVAEVYVPAAEMSQFSISSSWDAEGWTRYTVGTYTTDEN